MEGRPSRLIGLRRQDSHASSLTEGGGPLGQVRRQVFHKSASLGKPRSSMKRAVIVGAGGMGRAWGRTLKKAGIQVCGWVDILDGKPEEAYGDVELPKGWCGSDLSAALKEVAPDFVVDVTVPEAHCETVITALHMGYPVIGEKPMAASMEEAGRMVAASQKAGKLYMVSQSRRYLEGMEVYRPAVKSLGPLMTCTTSFFVGPHFGGFRDEMDSPLLLDMAIHQFDMARAVLGCNPVSVYAEEYNPDWSWYKGDASANCLFEFEGGLRWNYAGSWCAEGNPVSWNGDWRTIGRDGWASWDGERAFDGEEVLGGTGFFKDTKRREFSPLPTSYAGGIDGSLAEFLSALETGVKPQGECSDNIYSLAMVFAAIKSAKEGRRVQIAEVMP